MNALQDAGHFTVQAERLCAELGIEFFRVERRPASWFVAFRRRRDGRAFMDVVETSQAPEFAASWDWQSSFVRRLWSTVSNSVAVPHGDLPELVACLRAAVRANGVTR